MDLKSKHFAEKPDRWGPIVRGAIKIFALFLVGGALGWLTYLVSEAFPLGFFN